MKNRSRIEIVSSILDAANGGVTKTKIMYKAFLSYGLLRAYPKTPPLLYVIQAQAKCNIAI